MSLIDISKGVLLGLVVAAPVGPLAVLLISRTLRLGSAAGLASGLGCATADAICAGLAAFGISLAAGFLQTHAFWLQLGGGILLLALGLHNILQKSPMVAAARQDLGASHLWTSFASCALLTIANPMTLLAFSAILAGMTAAAVEIGAPGMLITGVFIGSMLWWLFLVAIARGLRSRLSPRLLLGFGRAAGVVLTCCGVGMLVSL